MSALGETPPILLLKPGEVLPKDLCPWGESTPIPGLLAAGGDLSVPSLVHAYRAGAFPWFGEGQSILWWSPEPRMVLRPAEFRLHRSLRKTWLRFLNTPGCEIAMDTTFRSVIEACAAARRPGQTGTWIVDSMLDAYTALHQAGFAHSVEVFQNGRLVGGLYCVNVGGMIFGESMFHAQTDASKWAVCALMGFCLFHQLPLVDCQQATSHLRFLGAQPIPRQEFLSAVSSLQTKPMPIWSWQREPMVQALLQRSPD